MIERGLEFPGPFIGFPVGMAGVAAKGDATGLAVVSVVSSEKGGEGRSDALGRCKIGKNVGGKMEGLGLSAGATYAGTFSVTASIDGVFVKGVSGPMYSTVATFESFNAWMLPSTIGRRPNISSTFE